MKFIIGNWKMNGTKEEKDTMFKELSKAKTKNKVVLCLPFTLISGENHGISIGAQDVSNHDNGAYTGDISATMLKDAGAQYVIVGHSERRLYHFETNEIVREKATIAIKNNIIPIICVGETMEEKNAGHTIAVIKKMLLESIPDNGEFIVAYEPRWAIGSGLTPTESEIITAVKTVFDALPNPMPILYGGSVNANNAQRIVSIPYVDGLLIGGASLKSETFLPIIKSIE
ncbi:MAG: triose-phosphate isomerase [Alphaproteobacteria bacterium]|nr:triose-phosphate isomerase [Alphaproteobacteria bacterium]